MSSKRVKSVIPIYAMGVVFFLYAVFMPMYRLGDPLLALSAAVVAHFIFRKIFPGKVVEVEMTYNSTGDKAIDENLKQGRSYLIRLDELKNHIKDEGVSRQIANLQKISRQIFDYIAKNPSQARKVNTFIDYYYPTAIKFLEHYVEFDSKGVKGENVNTTLVKIRESLAQFEVVFSNQLDNLYSDKVLDIQTDISVLEDMMKREGL